MDLPGTDAVNLMLLVGGGAVLASALFMRPMRHACLTGPMIATALGVLAGPVALNVFTPAAWPVGELLVLEQAARLTVALSLMRIAIALPGDYLRRRWRALAVTLFLGMAVMAAVSWGVGLVTVGLFGGLGVLGSLVVAACVTPTDPILAGTVAHGKAADDNLPGEMRHLVEAESAANDGLTYLLIFAPLLLLTRPIEQAWQEWLLVVLPWEVLGPVAIGALLGAAVGYLQRLDERHGWSGESDQTITALALTALALGALKLLGTDGLLGVFAAGVAFAAATPRDRLADEEKTIQNVAERLTELPVFVLFGAMLPWDRWLAWGWAGTGLVAGVLLLRRPVAALALAWPWRRLGVARRADEIAFLGWFGPVGVAALFYATFAHRHLHVAYAWELVSLVVLTSVLAHGLSAYPLTRLLGRRLGRA